MTKEKDRADKVLRTLDLMDWTPDYTKTPEEDDELMARRYKEAYGEWPPWMPEGPKPKPDESGSTAPGTGGE